MSVTEYLGRAESEAWEEIVVLGMLVCCWLSFDLSNMAVTEAVNRFVRMRCIEEMVSSSYR